MESTCDNCANRDGNLMCNSEYWDKSFFGKMGLGTQTDPKRRYRPSGSIPLISNCWYTNANFVVVAVAGNPELRQGQTLKRGDIVKL